MINNAKQYYRDNLATCKAYNNEYYLQNKDEILRKRKQERKKQNQFKIKPITKKEQRAAERKAKKEAKQSEKQVEELYKLLRNQQQQQEQQEQQALDINETPIPVVSFFRSSGCTVSFD